MNKKALHAWHFSKIWRMLFCLSVSIGCQRNDVDESDIIPLRKVSENRAYADLPLVGTKWKLVGFADEKQSTIKLAKPDDWKECFTLLFKGNGTIEGITASNGARGNYTINFSKNNEIIMTYFGAITEVGEVFDGEFYIECMKKVYAFRINSKGLALTYDKNQYLLFQPL